ncbi:peptidase domain-containing ABC transporter [Pseudoduganella armeniaca]|uniref:Cyclolysin secretion/processing ATP-binding protein CyaB n=1 Tax=Pseudoduganella armeniaca TaxID=2072590 RepID=A0A2R4C9W9_9BURK|nr:peptidase domain-containing ABC transporter [Pseudoduganella armeniaca]AVR96372.1 ABC transporter [Pseudoduganella armeniaca]
MLDRLHFHASKKVVPILQSEASECGLACIAMLNNYHGHHIDLRTLRQRFPISLKGASLSILMKVADRLQLTARAVRLEVEELQELKLPCILHWSLNHFVVLERVSGNTITICDPAHGRRKLRMSEVNECFTGVALELWPSPAFETNDPLPELKLNDLIGRLTGIRRSLTQVLILAGLLEIFGLLSPRLMQWTVDDVIVSADTDLLTTLIVGFGLLLVAQQFISVCRAWVLMYMSTNLSIQWRSNVFGHLLSLPTQYFERRHVGDVVSRFGSVDSIHQTLTSSFFAIALDGLMGLATLALMFLYSPQLAGVTVLAMLLYGVGRALWYRPLRLATQEQIVRAAKTQSHFLETVRGIRAIQLFQRRDERRSAWLSLLIAQVNSGLRTQKMQLVYQQFNALIFGAENLAVIWLGANMVMEGQFTVGMLVAYASYKSSFTSRSSNLIDKWFEVKLLYLQGQRLADIVMTAPDQATEDEGSERRSIEDGSIRLRGVEYRYAHGEPTVLNGITLDIQAGESVAIVGVSGCGKTTLLQLLLGILKPTQGEIVVGGVPLDQRGVMAARRATGTVMQDDVLFAGSIADNINFFDPNPDQALVEQCAHAASIHAEIIAMPMGYQTLVGDMGTVLSGGQKQRVLIARALYKKPQILILDEATSHMDVAGEARINAAIKALNITRVIVAHRPQTIASADRVIVLSNGRVIKDGPPSARDSAYAEPSPDMQLVEVA